MESASDIPCINARELSSELQTTGINVAGFEDVAHIGDQTVIGGGAGHVYSHKETGPVLLTVGSQDSNNY